MQYSCGALYGTLHPACAEDLKHSDHWGPPRGTFRSSFYPGGVWPGGLDSLAGHKIASRWTTITFRNRNVMRDHTKICLFVGLCRSVPRANMSNFEWCGYKLEGGFRVNGAATVCEWYVVPFLFGGCHFIWGAGHLEVRFAKNYHT